MMSKTSALTLAGAAVGSFLSFSAWALPAAPLDSKANSDVILAAEGCGPGWHRGPFGHCVRDREERREREHWERERYEREHRGCGFHWHWSPFRGRCVPD